QAEDGRRDRNVTGVQTCALPISWTCGTNAEYQKCQMKLQIEKENIFEQAARTMAVDKVLIVCDRGTLDNKAYMDDIEFAEAIQRSEEHTSELQSRFDLVCRLLLE